MNLESIKINIKRILSNPNTLTFLLVIGLIVVVYFVYDGLVSKAISPVVVPYATEQLKEKTKITNDMIGTVKISGSSVRASGQGLIQARGQILNKYVAEGYQIAENSFFYREALTDKNAADTTAFTNAPDGYTIFRLSVDFHSTYGCSIMPGNYIDLYFKAKDDEGKIIYEQFIKSIQVYKVVDKDGNDVFTSTDSEKDPVPKYLYFTVPLEFNDLLRKAQLISSNSIEIIPVPRNAGYSENPEATSITNEAIEQFILSKSVYIAN